MTFFYLLLIVGVIWGTAIAYQKYDKPEDDYPGVPIVITGVIFGLYFIGCLIKHWCS